MKKYLLPVLLMFGMNTYSARADDIMSFMIGATTGFLSAQSLFNPSVRNMAKNYLKKNFVTAMITTAIMVSPVVADSISENVNGRREYCAIAAVADVSVGICSAIYFRLGSTSPFNLSEDVLWPAVVFSVLKVPSLFLLFS